MIRLMYNLTIFIVKMFNRSKRFIIDYLEFYKMKTKINLAQKVKVQLDIN